ncbi:MAG: crossover junction endodeoxyribonuclease RuvC [Planctomycetes bacterium]|nr:crossover junction endodeoxyribonuclease RuvC [Planctomycetota bacterium]
MDGETRMEAVVCGIDPGLGTMGYAVVDTRGGAVCVLDAGVCRFDPRASLAHRLVAVRRDMDAILLEHRPGIVAVEELYAHYKHPRTSILMGHARGVILMAAAEAGCGVRGYAATKIKKYLTGHGRATKIQMQRAIQATLGLPDLPEPADVADALAIALCGAADLRQPKPTEVGR